MATHLFTEKYSFNSCCTLWLGRDYMCAARLGIGNLGVERRGGPAPPFICQIIIAELVTLPAPDSPRILNQHSSASHLELIS